MKSMCKYWGLHISTNINCLEVVLGSFWAVWRGLLLSLEPKLRFWWFSRYWWFNKQYHGGYQLICLISQPLLIASRRDWYWSKGLLKGFKLALRLWESSKNWWRYDWMKFVTQRHSIGWSMLKLVMLFMMLSQLTRHLKPSTMYSQVTRYLHLLNTVSADQHLLSPHPVVSGWLGPQRYQYRQYHCCGA